MALEDRGGGLRILHAVVVRDATIARCYRRRVLKLNPGRALSLTSSDGRDARPHAGRIRRDRRRRNHSCWGHLIVAPLWAQHGANLGTLPADLRRRRRLHGGTAARLGVRRTASRQHRPRSIVSIAPGIRPWIENERLKGSRIIGSNSSSRVPRGSPICPPPVGGPLSSRTRASRNRIRCSRPARRGRRDPDGRAQRESQRRGGRFAVLYRDSPACCGVPGRRQSSGRSTSRSSGSTSSRARSITSTRTIGSGAQRIR